MTCCGSSHSSLHRDGEYDGFHAAFNASEPQSSAGGGEGHLSLDGDSGPARAVPSAASAAEEERNFLRGPRVWDGSNTIDDSHPSVTIASLKERLSSQPADAKIQDAILQLIEQWKADRESVSPIRDMRDIIEPIRALPPSLERLEKMNTFARTLGEPNVLATFLDMLRDSDSRAGSQEQRLSRLSIKSDVRHSAYGWSAFSLLDSKNELLPSTSESCRARDEVYPEWEVTVNVWQRNTHAEGFESGAVFDAGVVAEPPHTHSFDFVSCVSIGRMEQTQYRQVDALDAQTFSKPGERYHNIALRHVDEVWPPHRYGADAYLAEIAPCFTIAQGETYFVQSDWIHDVAIDARHAETKPTITFLLSSETKATSHVYMSESMDAFHRANPSIKEACTALEPHERNSCFEAISAYLRGHDNKLDLKSIIGFESKYGFFHRNARDVAEKPTHS